MHGVNKETNRKVLLYVNDSETFIKSKHELHARSGTKEKFWALKIHESKYILDIQSKPLETYVNDDILNVLGYFKKLPCYDISGVKKTKHNNYCTTRRSIYSEQVYLPGEEFQVLKNNEIVTLIKKRPIDELFTILYIGQLTRVDINEEITAFLDDHGSKETCCMLLQIICNPQDTYQLNLRYLKKPNQQEQRTPTKGYGYSPMSRFEEQKGYEYDRDSAAAEDINIDTCEIKSPNEEVIEYAKDIFYKMSNTFPSTPTTRDYAVTMNGPRSSFVNNIATRDNEVQSIKLASLFLYLSRILQPIFNNFLVYITSVDEDAESYPNMGISEKRI